MSSAVAQTIPSERLLSGASQAFASVKFHGDLRDSEWKVLAYSVEKLCFEKRGKAICVLRSFSYSSCEGDVVSN